MKINKLLKFKENMKLYTILSVIAITITLIILTILAIIFNDERQIIYIRVILVLLVFDIIAIELMYEALTIRINKYNYDNDIYLLYAGVFNTYLFINEKEVLNNYSINCFNKLQMHYLYNDALIEFNLGALTNKVIFKIDGKIINRVVDK